jgi:putative mRNA 3-end processing factor
MGRSQSPFFTNIEVSKVDLLQLTDNGLYCPAGDFYIDPWKPVERAIVTHGHSDHARPGSRHYLTAQPGELVLRLRMGPEASIQTMAYGERVRLNSVDVSLHPAGHILGSAQVRLEGGGEVWVVSGDYKLAPDATCTPFEPVPCHTFVTEATFGLPIYRWPEQADVFAAIQAWWQLNQESGRASILYAYALGKAQRLLAGIEVSAGPIFSHGGVEKVNAVYRASGIPLPETRVASAAPGETDWSRALILAPPLARGTPWTRKFGDTATGLASGWMQIRGTRRRRAIDHGFVLSDHADWPALLTAIRATGAARVAVTHGYSAVLARWLQEHGLEAWVISTPFEGEQDESPVDGAEESAAEAET